MLRIIPRPTNCWLKLLSEHKLPFELLTLKNGDSIFLTDPSLILINIKGILSVTRNYITNQSSIVYLSTSNTVLHYKTNDTICYHKVQALTISHIIVFTHNDILSNSILAGYLRNIELYTLHLELLDLQYWMAIFTQNTVKKRLVVFLLMLSQLFGSPVDQGVAINLTLPHAYIAEVLCTTRITITRHINELKKNCFSLDRKRLFL
uniref:global nitrogen transcriptional regulator n=1 Tax=Pseudoerythrocladia kornmannii TaxID=753682 RepID=UPI001BEE7976|nr:global nitrogen transcriptional regulator [Pseudoerythrocladia kornmannii]QUE28254.1 ntcA [Pseudoerythrocladia kornmannii]UNJ16758.1 global nitrogen transcriptional regulator [Pseudoerythrocladia kornmannii]